MTAAQPQPPAARFLVTALCPAIDSGPARASRPGPHRDRAWLGWGPCPAQVLVLPVSCSQAPNPC